MTQETSKTDTCHCNSYSHVGVKKPREAGISHKAAAGGQQSKRQGLPASLLYNPTQLLSPVYIPPG